MNLATHYRVVHDTEYRYSSTVSSGRHFTHLSPRQTPTQTVLSHSLDCTPTPAERLETTDFFGNSCCSLLLATPHDRLLVSAFSEVAVQPPSHGSELLQQPWETALPPALHDPEENGVTEMRLPSPHVECLPDIERYARGFFLPERSWQEAMLALSCDIQSEFIYDPQATDIYTPVSEVFHKRHGVCQDFAHLMLSCLRSLKLPARYVSGYLLNTPPPGVEKLVGSDASHAWVESWLPGVGWVGFDPTNGKQANDEFITMAWGRDFMDVTPLRGVVLGGGNHQLEVKVSVTRLEAERL